MIDASSISAIATSLTTATTITKTLLGMKVDSEVLEKVSSLQSELMVAQSAALQGLSERAALLERVSQLENELKQVAAWETEKGRYKLETFPTGVQAYVLRPEAEGDDPTHRLCPNCFHEDRKSILQTYAKVRGGEVVRCPRCKLQLELKESAPAPPIQMKTGYF